MHIVHRKTTFYIKIFSVKSALHGNFALNAEGKQHCRTAGVDKAIMELKGFKYICIPLAQARA